MQLPLSYAEILNEENIIPLTNWNASKQTFEPGPGLYAFWWHGEHPGPLELGANPQVQFVGPAVAEGNGNHECSFVTDPGERFIATEELPFGSLCLYVGKSTNIRQRISQHLMAGTRSSAAYLAKGGVRAPDSYNAPRYVAPVSTVFKRNSSSQFRAGMEYLFRHKTQQDDALTWSLMEQHVFITQLPMDNDQDTANAAQDAFKRRFFGEDLLIGLLQPWFNLDGER